MRLLGYDKLRTLVSINYHCKKIRPYAMLSHRWSDSKISVVPSRVRVKTAFRRGLFLLFLRITNTRAIEAQSRYTFGKGIKALLHQHLI